MLIRARTHPAVNRARPFTRLRGRLPVILMALFLPLVLTFVFCARAGTPRLRTGIAYGDRLVWASDAELDSALDIASYVGAHFVRADLSWNDIQHAGPESHFWHLFDRVVAAATARGLTMLPVLTDTPPWGRPQGCESAHCAPRDPSAFAAFARTAAQRYAKRGVHTWEIWNEPNLSGFWKPAVDPAAYAKLLTVTAGALRQADPNALVVLGGLAATGTRGGNIAQTDFLAMVSALGGNHVVDAVGYHPYTYPYLPSAVTSFGTAWEKIDKTPVSLRGVLTRYGSPGLPVWVTEVGAPTGGPGMISNGSPATIGPDTTHVTESLQARIASDAVRSADADPHIQALIWYADRDLAAANSTEDFYGLYRANSTPKPALTALHDAIARLR
jgi:hypothetical protein